MSEHMEDDDDTMKSVPAWVQLEYLHMRMLAGPGANLHFTNLSKCSAASLMTLFESSAGSRLATASCHTQGVLDFFRSGRPLQRVDLDRVCLLDPKAELPLAPEDGDGRFEWFLFGGILGNDPPQDRTAQLRVLGFPSRHLGPVQMTTDTALGVTKRVVQDKVPLDGIAYIDHPTITFNARESVEMPFRYMADGPKPVLPPGMKQLLHEDLNKTFDF